MLIDTHCHLNFKAFNDDWQETAQRAFDNGVRGIVNIGSNYETSVKAVKLASAYRGKSLADGKLYAAIGLHPIHVSDEEFDVGQYEKLIADPYAVAVGETGLDLFHNPEDLGKQKDVFRQFLDLAYRSQRAVVIHNRAAGGEIMKILESIPSLPRGVMHFFSEDWQYAKKLFDLGFYISFTGAITLSNVDAKTIEVIKKAPLDKIMIETDAPYVVPHKQKNKKIKRNEPAFVTEVAARIAEIKNIGIDEVAARTTQTAIELFGLQ